MNQPNAVKGSSIAKKKPPVLWIVLGVIGFFILVGIIGSGDEPAATTQQTSAVSQTQQAASPAAPAAKPATWTKIATISGSGTKKTDTFSVGEQWKIIWDTKPGQMGDGNFVIQVCKPGDNMFMDLVANVIGASKDESFQHYDGTYYLDISSMQPYTIEIWDKR